MDPTDDFFRRMDEWMQGGYFSSILYNDVEQTNATTVSENRIGHVSRGLEEQGAFVYPAGINQKYFNEAAGEYYEVLLENGSVHRFQAPERQAALVYHVGKNHRPLNEAANENNNGGLSERIAATCEFSTQPQYFLNINGLLSPSCTNPHGPVSPSMLPDYPTIINPSVLPSPPVGKNAFAPTGNNIKSMLSIDDSEKENTCQNFNSSSFGFRYNNSLSYFNATDQANSNIGFCPETFTDPIVSYTSFQPQIIDTTEVYSQISASRQQVDFSESQNKNGGIYLSSEQTQNACGVTGLSQPLDQQKEKDVHQSSKDYNRILDGYHWRKYGTKHVKSSEYPRSYFKCTQKDCLARKKVEQTAEGIMETLNGSHNHHKPQHIRSSVTREMSLQFQQPPQLGLNDDLAWSFMKDNLDPISSIPQGQEYEKGFQAQNDTEHELLGGSINDVDAYEQDELIYKKRRVEIYTPEMGASRTMKKPKIVIHTHSEEDIMDDGFRWRKYGQKIVKGNPNPRSYYKCTSIGCDVRKQVERASTDFSLVITTYEGKHIHDIHAPRTTINFSPGGSKSFPMYESSKTQDGISH